MQRSNKKQVNYENAVINMYKSNLMECTTQLHSINKLYIECVLDFVNGAISVEVVQNVVMKTEAFMSELSECVKDYCTLHVKLNELLV